MQPLDNPHGFRIGGFLQISTLHSVRLVTTTSQTTRGWQGQTNLLTS